MGDRQWFLLYVLVCLEVGIFLALVPWSVIWQRNYFLEAYPSLRPFMLDPTLRGAVSGLGIANIYAVLHEVMERRRRAAASSTELFSEGFRPDRSPEHPSEEPSATDSRTVGVHHKRSYDG